jgi:hypothetical protein
MQQDAPSDTRFNTVSAIFPGTGRAESAVQRLRARGVADPVVETLQDGVVLTFDAGDSEDLVREVIAEEGGRLRDLPG